MNERKPFSETRKKMLQDPEFRLEYDALENEYAIIGQIIAARVRAGMTQADVARAMGVSQPAVAKVEAGKVKSLDTLRRYADAVGCKIKVELIPEA